MQDEIVTLMAWQVMVCWHIKNVKDAFQERCECQICHLHNKKQTARDFPFAQ